MTPENYATYLKITNFDTSGLAYNNNKLYITADHIKIKEDGDNGQVLFEAAGSSKTVYIGGWKVSDRGLYSAAGGPIQNSNYFLYSPVSTSGETSGI
jgi:hypothetical protein